MIAHDVLVRVETTDAFADLLLERRLDAAPLSPADRRLATQLVFGTIAWQAWLDARLAPLLTRPLDTLDPPVRVALRLGAMQVLRLDRIPAHAAIDQSVALAGHRGSRGLVNAVLRRLATGGGVEQDAPRGDALADLAARWSHPEWIVRLLDAEVRPPDLAALLAAHNEAGPTTLRVHAGRSSPAAVCEALARDGIDARPGRWASTAVVVTHGAAGLRGHGLLARGVVSVQGEASQLVTSFLDPRPGERILDLCAAPGGKTGHILERIGANGLVVALDPTRAGVRRVRAQARRAGPAPLVAAVADGRSPPLRPGFHGILVDAPCTGLGTLRRHPEIRWRRRPEDAGRLATLQRALLDAAAGLLRPGGRLVYAVCTLTHAETWGVVGPWLAAHPDVTLEPVDAILGPEAAPLADAGALRTLPAPHGLDGFFAVRLRRALDAAASE